ncbi:MAG: hypothetical protein JST22_14065 [Bacteroidetes bacterium]|nr:hypothetical protein [Bacteroidota bacterium]
MINRRIVPPILLVALASALHAQPGTSGTGDSPSPGAPSPGAPVRPRPTSPRDSSNPATPAQPTAATQPKGPARPAAPQQPAMTPQQRERAGRNLAREIVDAVGGLKAWNNPGWDISFDFVVVAGGKEIGRYSHQWLRSEDRYIVSGKNKDGKKWRVQFTSFSRRQGTATVDDRPAPDTLAAKLLDMAYARHINDTYWMLMPFKLLDSGVYHRQENDTTIDGKRCLVLGLSFGKVGLTPGDHYWLYVDPRTKHVVRWRYVLQSGREGEFTWDRYTRFGPLLISLLKRAADGSSEIRFENVHVETNGREER